MLFFCLVRAQSKKEKREEETLGTFVQSRWIVMIIRVLFTPYFFSSPSRSLYTLGVLLDGRRSHCVRVGRLTNFTTCHA